MAEFVSHMSHSGGHASGHASGREEIRGGTETAGAEKQGFLAKLVSKIQANPSSARAAVIAIGVLVLLIVIMLVYFRGIGPVGPFGAYVALRKTAPKTKEGMAPQEKSKPKLKSQPNPKDEDAPVVEKTETEELINELNAEDH